eukprot:gene10813-11967_t
MTVITDLLCRWELYIAIVCVFFISRIVQWWLNPLRKLPGPTGLPILGNTLDFSQSNDVHQMLLERAKKYGPIYKTYSLFVGTRVNISDPAFAKRILVTNSSNYYKNDGLRSFLPAMGNGLLTSSGREHAQQRKHLNPAFSMESVKGFISVFSDKGNELVKFWDTKINESGGKSVESEMMTKFIHLTLDVIGLCGFGYAFNCIMGENSEESKATNTILTGQFNVRQRLLETFLPFLKLFPSKERDRVKKAETILYGLIEHQPYQKTKSVSLLFTQMQEKPGNKSHEKMVGGEGDPLFPYYFLPFSRGPHMCIGYRFAQMEIKVVLAQLLNSFSFRLGKNQPEHVRGKALITLNPEPAPVIEISRA